MMTPDERYLRDPLFKSLVDILEGQIRDANMTPTEVREAAVLACIHHEQCRTHLRTDMAATLEQSRNVGHGHVFPRPDGARVRCGGPALCRDCANDAAIISNLRQLTEQQTALRGDPTAPGSGR